MCSSSSSRHTASIHYKPIGLLEALPMQTVMKNHQSLNITPSSVISTLLVPLSKQYLTPPAMCAAEAQLRLPQLLHQAYALLPAELAAKHDGAPAGLALQHAH
jgi:hypothetical protein